MLFRALTPPRTSVASARVRALSRVRSPYGPKATLPARPGSYTGRRWAPSTVVTIVRTAAGEGGAPVRSAKSR